MEKFESLIESDKTLEPPSDLTPEAMALWKRIVAELDLDTASLVVVGELCRAWDRVNAARAILAREGLTVKGHKTVKAHPAVAIESQASAALARCYKLLNLDEEPPGLLGRPPGRPSME